MMIPPWLEWARREIGVAEIVGERHNPRVVEYWLLGRVQLRVTDDETPWCAAIACAAIERSGFRSPRRANARSFLPPNPAVTALETPKLGAVVVLSSTRGPASGHVGFLEAASATTVWLLGGNQNNSVNVAPFPRDRVLAFVKPSGWAHDLPDAPAFFSGPRPRTVSDG